MIVKKVDRKGQDNKNERKDGWMRRTQARRDNKAKARSMMTLNTAYADVNEPGSH